jgi:hypothetical protein
MVTTNETFRRTRSVHKRRGASYVYPKGGDLATRSRVQETGRSGSAKTRAKAESQTLRLGSRELLFLNRFRLFLLHLAGKLGIRKALARDLGNCQSEPLGIVHILAGVIAERLFVDVAKQVVCFHTDVSPVQAALQETPKILHRVRVDVSVHVLYGVVDYGVLVIGFQTFVGLQGIAENRGTSFDALADNWLEFLLGTRGNMARNNLPPRSTIPKTISFPSGPRPVIFASRFDLCMLRAFPPMKLSSTSTSPPNFPPLVS